MAKGRLFIVATPIGNLEDITLRALRTLKSVGLIAAEDTRRSAHLLKHYDIPTSMTSYHDYTKPEKRHRLLNKILEGTDVALISDAGTPGISDPGYRLIREALDQGVEVCAVPGPSVLTAALSVSGLATDAFYFHGYLPNRESARKTCLQELSRRQETLILYEAPHRILDTLHTMREVLGNRQMALIREMTKLHEEIFRGPVGDALTHFKAREKIKGEITLVVEGVVEEETSRSEMEIASLVDHVIRDRKVTKKDAVQIVAETYGIPKNRVYKASLKR